MRRMREMESMLQQFAEFLLKARLVKENAAPHCVGWVRRFLTAATTEGALADRARRFCEELESRRVPDWQVRQAEQAIRSYFVNFLKRTDWRSRPGRPLISTARSILSRSSICSVAAFGLGTPAQGHRFRPGAHLRS